MLKWFKNLFKKKDLRDLIYDEKEIKINGVIFKIKKINTLDHLEGAKVMMRVYETYEQKRGDKGQELSAKKVKEFYKDIIMAGVVKPKLTRKKESGEDIYVEDIFSAGDMAEKLAEEIFTHTYGKKKIQHARSLVLNS